MLLPAVALVSCGDKSGKTNIIKIEGTDVTFEAPKGFGELSDEIKKTKWPSFNAPSFAIGTPSGTTTIAYDLKPHELPQEGLADFQRQMTALMGQIVPGIEWKRNEIIELSGQKWLYLEMTSDAIDTDIHNIMLATGYEQQLLVFNFNSTKEDFPKYSTMLQKSIQSIKLGK